MDVFHSPVGTCRPAGTESQLSLQFAVDVWVFAHFPERGFGPSVGSVGGFWKKGSTGRIARFWKERPHLASVESGLRPNRVNLEKRGRSGEKPFKLGPLV